MTRLKFSLVCVALAMATGGALPTIAHAEDVARDLPRVLKPISREATPAPAAPTPTPTPTPTPGDNLGDHQATRDLVMSGQGIQDVNEIVANYIWLGDGNVSGSLFARFFTTHSINLMNGRLQNVANPTVDGDAANLRTVKSLIAGPTNSLNDLQSQVNLLKSRVTELEEHISASQ